MKQNNQTVTCCGKGCKKKVVIPYRELPKSFEVGEMCPKCESEMIKRIDNEFIDSGSNNT